MIVSVYLLGKIKGYPPKRGAQNVLLEESGQHYALDWVELRIPYVIDHPSICFE